MSSCTPLAISTGAPQPLPSLRAAQMLTSGARSLEPPIQAQIKSSLVSTIVDACDVAVGGFCATNSDRTKPGCCVMASPEGCAKTENAAIDRAAKLERKILPEHTNVISDHF